MKITISAAVLAVFASSSYAFDLQSVRPAAIAAAEVPVPVSAPAAAARQYQSVWLSSFLNESWQEAEARGSSPDLDIRVRRTSKDMFDVSARMGGESSWLNLDKFGNNFSLSGDGVNLSMNGWNGNYNISGSVYGKDGKTQFVSATVFGCGGNSYSVNAAGLNLNVSRGGISGSCDDAQYSDKALASVITLVLAAQVDRMPARRAAEKNGERVWLSISSFGGSGQASASDPFSGIEAEIDRFGRNYSSYISADGADERGTISNFFSSSWEYRGAGSRLELVFGSSLRGEISAGGKNVRIDLNVNTTFGPGEFNINAEGLDLNVTRDGVNGEVDTAVYPKKLVAMITALAMAMQQTGGQNR